MDVSNIKINIDDVNIDLSSIIIDSSLSELTDENISRFGFFPNIHNISKLKKDKIKIINEENVQLNLDDFSDFKKDYIINTIDKIKYKKVSYFEMRDKINDIYYDSNEYYSSAMDIISSYVRGQKLIYMEAENFCKTRLNRLMFPAIFFSATASVLAVALDGYSWGPTSIATINAGISFLLAVVSYLKLDAEAEAHKTTSHQYDTPSIELPRH